MINVNLLKLAGINRTNDTVNDTLEFFKVLNQNPILIANAIETCEKDFGPFYNFFSNFGTGIGETMEDVVEQKFKDVVPKNKSTKHIYETFYKDNNCKASNFDRLLDGKPLEVQQTRLRLEVKVIRAAEGKPKQNTQGFKFQEVPSLLEERALTYADISRGGNGSFQQTKAKEFDYMIGVLICKDQVRLYLVPSTDILDGTLKITNQHAGAISEDGTTTEGHLSLVDVIAGDYLIGTYTNHKELFSKEILAKYIHDSNL